MEGGGPVLSGLSARFSWTVQEQADYLINDYLRPFDDISVLPYPSIYPATCLYTLIYRHNSYPPFTAPSLTDEPLDDVTEYSKNLGPEGRSGERLRRNVRCTPGEA